jgi:hypothetical protein
MTLSNLVMRELHEQRSEGHFESFKAMSSESVAPGRAGKNSGGRANNTFSVEEGGVIDT